MPEPPRPSRQRDPLQGHRMHGDVACVSADDQDARGCGLQEKDKGPTGPTAIAEFRQLVNFQLANLEEMLVAHYVYASGGVDEASVIDGEACSLAGNLASGGSKLSLKGPMPLGGPKPEAVGSLQSRQQARHKAIQIALQSHHKLLCEDLDKHLPGDKAGDDPGHAAAEAVASQALESDPPKVTGSDEPENAGATGKTGVTSKLRSLKSRITEINRQPTNSTLAQNAWAEQTTAEWLDLAIGILIMFNAIVLMAQYEWEGHLSGIALGVKENDDSWNNAEEWFYILEHGFNAMYVIDLIARIVIYRRSYFKSCLDLFDALIVILSSLDLYVLRTIMSDQDLGINTGILRFFRLVKVVKALRIVRAISIFADLRVLVQTMVSCIRSLLTGMLLLGAMMLIGGIIMCQSLTETIRNPAEDPEIRDFAWTFYGSTFRATYTMFEVTMAGCWPNYVRPLIKRFGAGYAVFFMIYVAWVVFAVIRLITAIFLKETMDAANADHEMVAAQQMRQKAAYFNKLRRVFDEADESGDGVLDVAEFEEILENPKVRTWLQVLGLEIHEAKSIFPLLDDGDGLVTVEEFMKGVTRLKGQSRSVDVIAIQHDVDRLRHDVFAVREGFEAVFGWKTTAGKRSSRQKGGP